MEAFYMMNLIHVKNSNYSHILINQYLHITFKNIKLVLFAKFSLINTDLPLNFLDIHVHKKV